MTVNLATKRRLCPDKGDDPAELPLSGAEIHVRISHSRWKVTDRSRGIRPEGKSIGSPWDGN